MGPVCVSKWAERAPPLLSFPSIPPFVLCAGDGSAAHRRMRKEGFLCRCILNEVATTESRERERDHSAHHPSFTSAASFFRERRPKKSERIERGREGSTREGGERPGWEDSFLFLSVLGGVRDSFVMKTEREEAEEGEEKRERRSTCWTDGERREGDIREDGRKVCERGQRSKRQRG